MLNDVVRIGGIGYPQRSAIVSGYALEQQWTTCTPEASHKLASAVAGEAETKLFGPNAEVRTMGSHRTMWVRCDVLPLCAMSTYVRATLL